MTFGSTGDMDSGLLGVPCASEQSLSPGPPPATESICAFSPAVSYKLDLFTWALH